MKARPYRMTNRAAAQKATREAIAASGLELFLARPFDDVTLREIAAGAGVTHQTVVNHFGSKEGVLAAAATTFRGQVEDVRAGAEPDDVPGAVAVLMADYERTADANARLLAVEERVPAVRDVLDEGRRFHRGWVERTFPGAIADRTGTGAGAAHRAARGGHGRPDVEAAAA